MGSHNAREGRETSARQAPSCLSAFVRTGSAFGKALPRPAIHPGLGKSVSDTNFQSVEKPWREIGRSATSAGIIMGAGVATGPHLSQL